MHILFLVAGRHPLKQGLKLKYVDTYIATFDGRRAASTKTRIETNMVAQYEMNATSVSQGGIH